MTNKKKKIPDTWGANYWWMSLCTMASAEFCNLFLDTLYMHRHSHWHKPIDIGLLYFFRTSCAHQCVLSHRVINRLTQTHASKRLFVQHIQHWPQIIFINHGLFSIYWYSGCVIEMQHKFLKWISQNCCYIQYICIYAFMHMNRRYVCDCTNHMSLVALRKQMVEMTFKMSFFQ